MGKEAEGTSLFLADTCCVNWHKSQSFSGFRRFICEKKGQMK